MSEGLKQPCASYGIVMVGVAQSKPWLQVAKSARGDYPCNTELSTMMIFILHSRMASLLVLVKPLLLVS